MRSRPLLAFLLVFAPLAGQGADYVITAAPGVATVAPGLAIPALMYDGAIPGPVLHATQGQPLRVRFVNGLAAPSSVHFHGINMPSGMDGVIGLSRPAVAPGQEFLYEFTPPEAGTYWYHPHVEDQMTSGLYGTLVVAPANPADDPPFDQDVVVVLHDDTTQAGGMTGGMMGGTAPGFAGHLLNGATSAGQTPIAVQAGQTLRLRFVNAAASTSYVVALDGHALTVGHADGRRVQPVSVGAIPLGPGERYDAFVALNNPGVWSLAVASITNRNAVLVRGVVAYAGSGAPTPAANYVPPALATGSLLSYAQLAAYGPTTPISTSPNRVYPATLGMTMGGMSGGMGFTINGQSWPNVPPFVVAQSETVQINFSNTTMMMMGSFRHPMHLHGHAFRLMGTAGGTTNAPLKDTLLVRPVGQAWSSASVQFTADNPGEWMFHCHDVQHQMMGMMATVEYLGDADGDGLSNVLDLDPLTPQPVLTIPSLASSFVQGGSGVVGVQASTGSVVHAYVGVPATTPTSLAPYGTLFLDLPIYVGSAVSVGNVASFPYVVPTGPGLAGLRVGLQAAAGVGFAPYVLLSTWQPMTVQ